MRGGEERVNCLHSLSNQILPTKFRFSSILHRYDALGDSPGAPGPSRQPPRSPSVYSQFSQSVFSQSAYGPSAYGPSQRRLTGSVYGHSQYENASSQGSQYPGPVPSHFGASQLSENTSYHASGSGASHNPGGAFVQGNIPATYGGDMGRGAGMAQRLPPPTYNPYASRQGGSRVAAGRGVGIVGMRGMASGQGPAAGGLAVAQEGVAVSGFNRGRCVFVKVLEYYWLVLIHT